MRATAMRAVDEAADIHADLKARILALTLPPGSLLSRTELQAAYAVSSTPVRDALLRLQDEGLVDIYPQSRTLVSRIDLCQAREAHFLRSSVERSVVRKLAGQPNGDLVRKLEHVTALQVDCETAGDLAGFASLDLTFHRTMFEAADLMRLHHVIRRESVHIDRLRALHLPLGDKSARIVDEHRAIIAAIAGGNDEAADAAMAFHLSQSIMIATQLSRAQPDYFKP
ncbi:MAG: GntR family transcriptional regulator [Rhizobiaceae bacterium]|nr:GntR family transcriptional regulator [Rhizobiaceae bacterium]